MCCACVSLSTFFCPFLISLSVHTREPDFTLAWYRWSFDIRLWMGSNLTPTHSLESLAVREDVCKPVPCILPPLPAVSRSSFVMTFGPFGKWHSLYFFFCNSSATKYRPGAVLRGHRADPSKWASQGTRSKACQGLETCSFVRCGRYRLVLDVLGELGRSGFS